MVHFTSARHHVTLICDILEAFAITCFIMFKRRYVLIWLWLNVPANRIFNHVGMEPQPVQLGA